MPSSTHCEHYQYFCHLSDVTGLQWLKDQGGVALMEAQNEAKAKLIYDAIDGSDFYYGTADAAHRSVMNVHSIFTRKIYWASS